jgi:hypothetical protein
MTTSFASGMLPTFRLELPSLAFETTKRQSRLWPGVHGKRICWPQEGELSIEPSNFGTLRPVLYWIRWTRNPRCLLWCGARIALQGRLSLLMASLSTKFAFGHTLLLQRSLSSADTHRGMNWIEIEVNFIFRILCMSQSPDGERIVSASADETLRFWKIFDRESKTSKAKAQPQSNLSKSATLMLRWTPFCAFAEPSKQTGKRTQVWSYHLPLPTLGRHFQFCNKSSLPSCFLLGTGSASYCCEGISWLWHVASTVWFAA